MLHKFLRTRPQPRIPLPTKEDVAVALETKRQHYAQPAKLSGFGFPRLSGKISSKEVAKARAEHIRLASHMLTSHNIQA
jgi:hypothetical protein